jgi:hypothetical protein
LEDKERCACFVFGELVLERYGEMLLMWKLALYVFAFLNYLNK